MEVFSASSKKPYIRFLHDDMYKIYIAGSILLLGRGFVTTNDGRIGLATRATYPGDHIAILHGLSIPFIVRPIRCSPKRCVYQVVGPCYIHSLMHATEDDVQSPSRGVNTIAQRIVSKRNKKTTGSP